MMSEPAPSRARDTIRFGPFFFSIPNRQLRHNATTVHLKPKEAELLALLASSRGTAVTYDEIMDAMWRGLRVTEYALTQTVYRLRRALERFDKTTNYIRTVPGVGVHLVQLPDEPETVDLHFGDPAFPEYQAAVFKLAQRTESGIVESIRLFESSLAKSPSFPQALIGMAQANINASIRSLIDPERGYYRAKTLLARALEINPRDADAFALLSRLILFFDVDFRRARDAAEQAVLLAPLSFKSRNAMVWQLLARQDYAGALADVDRALRANPSDAHLNTLLGIVLYVLKRYDDACLHFKTALRFSPTYAPALYYYASALYMTERFDDSLRLLDRMSGTDMAPKELALRGCIAIRVGDDAVRRVCKESLEEYRFSADIPIAAMHTTSRKLDLAAAALATALQTREPGLFLATVDPIYEPIHASHPLLVAAVRHGRRPSCDKCIAPIPEASASPYALNLCDNCLELSRTDANHPFRKASLKN